MRKTIAVALLTGALAVGCVGVVGCSGGSGDGAAQEPAAQEQQSENLAPGAAFTTESGLAVSVDSVQTGLANYDGSAIVGITVTYVNNGEETAAYNMYDWKGETSSGARENFTIYLNATDQLSSGDLAPGGSVTGTMYFEGDTVKALYYASMLDDEPTASWTLA